MWAILFYPTFKKELGFKNEVNSFHHRGVVPRRLDDPLEVIGQPFLWPDKIIPLFREES